MIGPEIARLADNKMNQPAAALEVDVIADLICPWCYLGKKRLEDALVAGHGPSVVSWYPFQLNPAMPDTGMPLEEYLASKFGEPESLQPGLRQLTDTGKTLGINFRFDKISRVPNTLDAHRLMKLAEEQGASTADVSTHILAAFFEHGLDIADRDVLIDIGAKNGLTPAHINNTLDDDLSRRAVLSQEAQVRQSGVKGVPDFLVNKRLLVIGAQSTDSLVNVFDRVMFGEESDQPVSETLH